VSYNRLMVRVVIAAIAILSIQAACGKVSNNPDGGAPNDGRIDGGTCPGDEVICDSDGCTDVVTDERHCGSCTTSCTNQQGCLGATCVESCARIKALDPNAIDGPYTHVATGKQFFCDMTHGAIQYDELAIGQYNAAHPGYTIINAAELSDPVIQQAFIWLYNHQGGGLINNTANWTSGNCCITATPAGGIRLQIRGSILFVATFGSPTSGCNTAYPAAKYSYHLATPPAEFPGNSLPTDYFATRPATEAAACGDDNNPAFYFKRTP